MACRTAPEDKKLTNTGNTKIREEFRRDNMKIKRRYLAIDILFK